MYIYGVHCLYMASWHHKVDTKCTYFSGTIFMHDFLSRNLTQRVYTICIRLNIYVCTRSCCVRAFVLCSCVNNVLIVCQQWVHNMSTMFCVYVRVRVQQQRFVRVQLHKEYTQYAYVLCFVSRSHIRKVYTIHIWWKECVFVTRVFKNALKTCTQSVHDAYLLERARF